MRRITDIIDRMGVSSHSPAADLVTASYIFSAKCHAGQLRKSGEPYLMHPLEVAYILSDLGMDAATISTGRGSASVAVKIPGRLRKQRHPRRSRLW